MTIVPVFQRYLWWPSWVPGGGARLEINPLWRIHLRIASEIGISERNTCMSNGVSQQNKTHPHHDWWSISHPSSSALGHIVAQQFRYLRSSMIRRPKDIVQITDTSDMLSCSRLSGHAARSWAWSELDYSPSFDWSVSLHMTQRDDWVL